MLGERTAEEIKMAVGSARPSPAEPHAEIRGRDLVSGLPKTIVIGAGEVRHAIAGPVSAVVDIVKTTLDKRPPELADAGPQLARRYCSMSCSLVVRWWLSRWSPDTRGPDWCRARAGQRGRAVSRCAPACR